MKFLLISDIHLGVKNNNLQFLDSTKNYFLNNVCDIIEKEQIDCLFILGDLFDDREMLNVLVKCYAIDIMNYILQKFSKLKIKILAGNHDLYYKNSTEVGSLNIFKKFDERLEIITQIKKYKIKDFNLLIVPWLVEGSNNFNEFNSIINDYKDTNNIKFHGCFGHFSINGFEIIHGVIEKKGINSSDFKAFEHVFSGHFHIRNKIDNIQYLGSPYEITWNDYGNIKGITIFDTETKETKFFENTTSPKHKIIRISDIENISDIDVKNCIIKLIIDKNIDIDKKMEILDHLEKNCLQFNQLDNTVSIDNDGVDIDEKILASPIEFLVNYYNDIKLPDNIDKNKLKLKIESLFNRMVRK